MHEERILKNLVLKRLTNAVEVFLKKIQKLEDYPKCKIRLEYSRNEKFGDYSTSFLMENKAILGNPLENQKIFLDCFEKNEIFSEITFTPPGFINFRIDRNFLLNYVKNFSSLGENLFPKVANSEKIIFEFVSANPTGPLNIVSARAAANGDSICNLLEAIGHEVFREFYVNDYGNQVFLLGVSCVCRLREFLGENMQVQAEEDESSLQELLEKNILPKEGYRGEYLIEITKDLYNEHKSNIDFLLKEKNYFSLAEKFSIWAVEKILSTHKFDLEKFGVHFDNFFSERSLHDSGKVLAVLEYLKDDLKEEDGKKIFLSTKYGDDKDRVVVREDGRPTYLLADIAYHKDKMERGFQRMINIWGPDHHGYIARLSGAIQSMGYKKEVFQVLIAQQVNLISKGEKVKMSKRLGKFQTMSELLEFLGEKSKDVARYFFTTRALETPLDFDLDLAVEESEKNPVFYVQYAHARICSIFREVEMDINEEDFLNLPFTKEREELLFWIARFPEEVLDAAKAMEPHRLTIYLQNLCKAFSKFYIAKENKLKDCNKKEKNGLGYLCNLTAICIRETLNLLKVSAPEIMEREKV